MNPTDVARLLIDADARQAVDEVLALTHAEAADLFKEHQLTALRPVTWDELKYRAGPHAKRLRAAIEHNEEYVLRTAYRVASLDELRALPPMELLGRRLAEACRGSGTAHNMHIAVVGSLSLDTDTEYAVLQRRNLVDGRPVPDRPLRVEVMTLRRASENWRSMLDGGLQGGQLFALGAENSRFPLPA